MKNFKNIILVLTFALTFALAGNSLIAQTGEGSGGTGEISGGGAAAGDVAGPASSTDNAIAVFNGTGGKTLQDSNAILDVGGTEGLSGIPTLTYAGAFTLTATDSALSVVVGTGAGDNFTLNTTGLVYQGITGWIGFARVPTTQLDVFLNSTDHFLIDGETNERGVTIGAMRQLHKPSVTGTRAKNYVIDANGMADTKAITIEYTATGLAAGDTNAGIDVTIDTANSTGGEISAIHMSSIGSGGIAPSVMLANVGVAPIRHDSGAYGAIEQVWEFTAGPTWADSTAAFNSTVTDVEIFTLDDDYIYIGDAAQFSDISVILEIAAANPGVKPIFEFSAGASSWTAFGATDGTNGFRINGSITWTTSDLSGWTTDTVNAVASKYWIRIQRTANTLSTAPTEDIIQISAPIRYLWNANGDTYMNTLGVGAISGAANQAHFLMDADKDIFIDGATNPRTIDTGITRYAHVPAIENTRCMTKNIDVNSQPSTHADVVNIVLTGLVDGESASGYDVNVDRSTATGGVVRGFEMSIAGAGTAEGHLMHADPGIVPMSQFSGSFINVEQAWDENGGFTDVTAAFNSTGTDVTLFDTNGDMVHIGMATAFNEIEVNLDTFAGGAGIKPTFQYSSGGGTPVWTTFVPEAEETQGFRQSGVINWTVTDLTGPTWAVATINGVSKMYIRITRTQASIPTDPIEDTIQVLNTTNYGWDENGDVDINSLESPIVSGGTGTADDLILQPTTGVGTTDAEVIIKTGNNGAVTSIIVNSEKIVLGPTNGLTLSTVDGKLSSQPGSLLIGDDVGIEGEVVVGMPTGGGQGGGSINAESISVNGVAVSTGSGSGINKNLITNGKFDVVQRGISFTSATTPANSDDNYLLDQAILLSDGNDIVDVTQEDSVFTGFQKSLKFDVETASKKFGYLHIVEGVNARHIIGGTASLSFTAKVNNISAGRLDNIKAVVLSWDSTIDAVTSDVVSAWNAEDTIPTFATNWTAENTPANLNVTTSEARYTIENISIDTASTTNVAVFIWADGLSGTVTDTFELTGVKLEPGASATDFKYEDITATFAKCFRYFVLTDTASPALLSAATVDADTVQIHLDLPVVMRVVPSITAQASSDIGVFFSDAAVITPSSLSFTNINSGDGVNSVGFWSNNYTGMTGSRLCGVQIQTQGLFISAEL